MTPLRFAWVVVPLLAACGSNSNPGGAAEPLTGIVDVDADTGDASDAGVEGDTPDSRVRCPTEPPADGSACTDSYLRCSWGNDPRFGCRTAALCEEGEWLVVPNEQTSWQCPAAEPSCPATAPASAGEEVTCDPSEYGLTCMYGNAAFTCAPCNGSFCVATGGHANYTWHVSALHHGCPLDGVPNWGAPCDDEGLSCDYNQCADDIIGSPGDWAPWEHGAAMVCQHGTWTNHSGTDCY